MLLTKSLSKTASEQLRALVRPTIDVRYTFGGKFENGEESFSDTIYIRITNTATVAILLQSVVAEWKHSEQIGNVQREVSPFRHMVVGSQQRVSRSLRMIVDGKPPTVDHFPSWSDFVDVDVVCSDLAGLSTATYRYEQASGLTVI
jgi:hypothetical protein